jgi:hypothetical protein
MMQTSLDVPKRSYCQLLARNSYTIADAKFQARYADAKFQADLPSHVAQRCSGGGQFLLLSWTTAIRKSKAKISQM